MQVELKNDLLSKIKIAEEIFCEYDKYEHLYKPLVYLSNFTILRGAAHMSRFKDFPDSEFENCDIFYRNLTKLSNHLSNLFTIITRIDSYKNKTKDELPTMWREYIGLDIQYFHVEYRSLMDFVPEIISKNANKKTRFRVALLTAWLTGTINMKNKHQICMGKNFLNA